MRFPLAAAGLLLVMMQIAGLGITGAGAAPARPVFDIATPLVVEHVRAPRLGRRSPVATRRPHWNHNFSARPRGRAGI